MSGSLRPEFSLKTAVLLASIAGTAVALNLSVISLDAENASATQDNAALTAPTSPTSADAKGLATKVLVVDVTVPVDVGGSGAVDDLGSSVAAVSSALGASGFSQGASSSVASATSTSTSSTSAVPTSIPVTTSPVVTVPVQPATTVVIPGTAPTSTTQVTAPSSSSYDDDDDSYDDDDDDDSYDDDDDSYDDDSSSPASTTPVAATETEYLYYTFDGVASSVVVALHDGNRLEFWSATPEAGWTFRLDDASARQIEVEFFNEGSGAEAKFKVEFDGSSLKIKRER